MFTELLQFGLTLLAIFLPLMVGCAIVFFPEIRKQRARMHRSMHRDDAHSHRI